MKRPNTLLSVPEHTARGEALEYSIPEIISLKGHPTYSEQWLHDRICENPSILGLGEVILRDRERRQPRAGRLDLLLENIEDRRRFEVEIQLGASDESHIIRAVEYWDIERKRYPQYEHCAVLIAEDITTRFLNVINLFNGQIPLIALQVKALKIEQKLSLYFTRVVDEMKLGYEDIEGTQLETDRNYWLERATADTLGVVDDLMKVITGFAPGYQLKYNKYYIGLSKNGRSDNFVVFKPQKRFVRLEIGMELSKATQERLERAGIEVFDFIPRWTFHPIKISAEHLKEHEVLLSEIIKAAYDEYFS